MSDTRWDRFADWANEVAADPRRRRRWALVLVVAGLATLGIFHQRIYNTLAGPFALEARELAHMHDVPFRSFAKLTRDGKPVKFSDLSTTGLQEVRVKSGYTETVAVFSTLSIDGKDINVRIEQGQSYDDVEGIVRDNDRGAGLVLDCRKTSYRSWSLVIAGLGVLAVLLGLDQLRRSRSRPSERPQNPIRRFT